MNTNTKPQATAKWYVSDGAVISDKLLDYGNFIVAACQRERTAQDEAHLILIAAAPALLAACEEYIAAYGQPDAWEPSWVTDMRAAIALAKGGGK